MITACRLGISKITADSAIEVMCERTSSQAAAYGVGVSPHKATNVGRISDSGRYSWPCAEKGAALDEVRCASDTKHVTHNHGR